MCVDVLLAGLLFDELNKFGYVEVGAPAFSYPYSCEVSHRAHAGEGPAWLC
ncbi:hypothetical protein IWX81_001140 [Salinibacterium sp. CAN_S4]